MLCVHSHSYLRDDFAASLPRRVFALTALCVEATGDCALRLRDNPLRVFRNCLAFSASASPHSGPRWLPCIIPHASLFSLASVGATCYDTAMKYITDFRAPSPTATTAASSYVADTHKQRLATLQDTTLFPGVYVFNERKTRQARLLPKGGPNSWPPRFGGQ